MTRALAAVCLALAVMAAAISAQTDVDTAISFFSGGGSYCFRVAPEGVSLSDETEWTVIVLTSARNQNDTFRIRTVDPEQTKLSGSALAHARGAVTGVWRLERSRTDFFERFAAGIDSGNLRAKVVKLTPAGLAEMVPRRRAEEYLKFAARGSQVSFKNVPDLTGDAFREYVTYFPD